MAPKPLWFLSVTHDILQMTYRNFNNETTRSSVLKAVADTENEAAWARFFDLYAGFVFSIARSKGLKDEEADDIVQEVFVRLAGVLPTFEYDRTKGRFRSYLINLVRNLIIDKWRILQRDKKQMKSYVDEKVDAPLEKTEFVEIKRPSIALDENAKFAFVDKEFAEREWQAAALEEALRRIKSEVRPEHYAAFVASAVEGQDTETVMRLYNLSRDNLYQIRKRLMAKLKPVIATVLKEMDDVRLPYAGGEGPRR